MRALTIGDYDGNHMIFGIEVNDGAEIIKSDDDGDAQTLAINVDFNQATKVLYLIDTVLSKPHIDLDNLGIDLNQKPDNSTCDILSSLTCSIGPKHGLDHDCYHIKPRIIWHWQDELSHVTEGEDNRGSIGIQFPHLSRLVIESGNNKRMLFGVWVTVSDIVLLRQIILRYLNDYDDTRERNELNKFASGLVPLQDEDVVTDCKCYDWEDQTPLACNDLLRESSLGVSFYSALMDEPDSRWL